MGVPATFIPKITAAGEASAISASESGIKVRLTHVAFGTGQYDPTGAETALFNEVFRAPVTGAMRPKPNQLRVAGVWSEYLAESEIGEVGFYAGDVLFAIWSRETGGPIGFKTAGVDFVIFAELVFSSIPADSIEVVINPDVSEALSALVVHEAADNAHPQYLLRSNFVNAHRLMLAESVGGTANAVALSLSPELSIPDYELGMQVAFVAQANNTGPVMVSVNGMPLKPIRKFGSVSLASGDIISGAYYTLFFDGLGFQISGGIGGGAVMTPTVATATAGQNVFPAAYTPGSILVYVNGRLLSGADYTAIDGAEVILATPASAGDVVIVLAFKSFAIADHYNKVESDARYLRSNDTEVLQPPGMIAHFARDTPPPGWLVADGSVVSRVTYAKLYNAIGTRFGAGDGSTTFRLPDLRGEFLRGWDNGRGVDPGRIMGSSQTQAIQAHDHATTADGKYSKGTGGTGAYGIDAAGTATDIRTGSTGGGETRPRNIALLACIRYA